MRSSRRLAAQIHAFAASSRPAIGCPIKVLAVGAAIAALAGCSSLSKLQEVLPGHSSPATSSTPTQLAKPAPARLSAGDSKAVQLNNLGVSKLEKADYKGALSAFNQAIQVNPKLAEAYLGKGIAYVGLNNRPAAIAAYDRAIKLNATFADAYLNRSDEYIELNKKPQAFADLNKAIALYKKQGDTLSAEQTQIRLNRLKNPLTVPSLAPEPAPVAAKPTGASAEVALANHLKQIGAKMYTTFWCPYCRRQEQLFQDAVSRLTIIECDPNGANAQPQLCAQANVSSYPSWEINGQLYRGMRSLEDLAQISGYQGSRNFSGS